jgi:hypothetical protein
LLVFRFVRSELVQIGQYVSMMNFIPPQYGQVLYVLQSDAPRSSKEDISRVFEEDFGHNLEYALCTHCTLCACVCVRVRAEVAAIISKNSMMCLLALPRLRKCIVPSRTMVAKSL